jgi:hypothetical protein
MLELTLRYPASAIVGKQRLTRDDAQMLRRWMFPKGLAQGADAWQLLAIHRSAPEKSLDWSRWFVEAMADFFVNHGYPRRCLDAERAESLMTMIAPDGVIRDEDELELLLHALELADNVAHTLPALALDQLRLALEGGEGAYAAQRRVKRSGISGDDLDYVYRIVRGRLERGRLGVTLREAAALRRIDTSVRGRMNHPGWRILIDSIQVIASETAPQRGWLTVTHSTHLALDDAA